MTSKLIPSGAQRLTGKALSPSGLPGCNIPEYCTPSVSFLRGNGATHLRKTRLTRVETAACLCGATLEQGSLPCNSKGSHEQKQHMEENSSNRREPSQEERRLGAVTEQRIMLLNRRDSLENTVHTPEFKMLSFRSQT